MSLYFTILTPLSGISEFESKLTICSRFCLKFRLHCSFQLRLRCLRLLTLFDLCRATILMPTKFQVILQILTNQRSDTATGCKSDYSTVSYFFSAPSCYLSLIIFDRALHYASSSQDVEFWSVISDRPRSRSLP